MPIRIWEMWIILLVYTYLFTVLVHFQRLLRYAMYTWVWPSQKHKWDVEWTSVAIGTRQSNVRLIFLVKSVWLECHWGLLSIWNDFSTTIHLSQSTAGYSSRPSILDARHQAHRRPTPTTGRFRSADEAQWNWQRRLAKQVSSNVFNAFFWWHSFGISTNVFLNIPKAK